MPALNMEEDVLLVNDVEIEGSSPPGGVVSVWTLNRPEKLNALNEKIHLSIKKQCKRVDSDDRVRCIIIRGAPPLDPPEGKRKKPNSFANDSVRISRNSRVRTPMM